jgi:hypothetical protein
VLRRIEIQGFNVQDSSRKASIHAGCRRFAGPTKYLNRAIHSDGDIPFSREVDEIWQYWVLETAEYLALCRKLPAGGFIHHTSNDYVEFSEEGVKNKKIGLARGWAIPNAYVLNYGPFQADRIRYWPVARRTAVLGLAA